MIKKLAYREVQTVSGAAGCWCISASPGAQVWKQHGFVSAAHSTKVIGPVSGWEGNIDWYGELNQPECINKCCNEIHSFSWMWSFDAQPGHAVKTGDC